MKVNDSDTVKWIIEGCIMVHKPKSDDGKNWYCERCREKLKDLIKEAELKIIETANFDKDKELGTAINRLNDIYRKSIAARDIKTALQAQREIDKLQDLYREEGDQGANELDMTGALYAEKELQAIAEHLLPLELADSSYPLREHARIASERIREAQSFDETE